MTFKEYKDVRRGGKLLWKMETVHGFVSGQTVDNLDVKKLSDACNEYEKVFITIRDVLLENESSCMDNEDERLNCTQQIADTLRAKGFLKK